jgi:hypothetical protein
MQPPTAVIMQSQSRGFYFISSLSAAVSLWAHVQLSGVMGHASELRMPRSRIAAILISKSNTSNSRLIHRMRVGPCGRMLAQLTHHLLPCLIYGTRFPFSPAGIPCSLPCCLNR